MQSLASNRAAHTESARCSMKRKTVIKWSSLPSRLPVSFGILWWLLLDRLAAPAWAYGVLWTVVCLGTIAFVIDFCRTDMRDVPGFGEPK